ncbi:MAG: hypothetical protein O6830_02235 [Candidatus Dadabacteria bacterium]|nr:hypothetical protein [Candidatus Dadabacteria bacterium]
MKNSRHTADGRLTQNLVLYGSPTRSAPIGNLTLTVGGSGRSRAGYGSLTNLGAGLHIITEDGSMMITRAGYGFQEPLGRPHGLAGNKALSI